MKAKKTYFQAKTDIAHQGDHVPAGGVVEVDDNSTQHVDLLTSGRCQEVTREEFLAWQKRPSKVEKGTVAVA